MKRKTGWKVVKDLWSVCPGTRVFSPTIPWFTYYMDKSLSGGISH